jgi:hypothetical protein
MSAPPTRKPRAICSADGRGAAPPSDGILDEAYERFHRTGPEFEGFLSNHGPMAADVLIRLGAADQVPGWVQGYLRRLEEPPAATRPIDPAQWRAALGDPARLGDWLALFERLMQDDPWQDVLRTWWPRLLPGAVAAATHCLIRTGHAVRALRAEITDPRTSELAQALGYWAARWQPVPGPGPRRGRLPVGAALDGVPPLGASAAGVSDAVRERLAVVQAAGGWQPALDAIVEPGPADAVPQALNDLTDAAVGRYLRWAHGEPVLLVHAATAPRAAGLVLPSLPRSLWIDTYTAAWTVSAAITAAYRPLDPAPAEPPVHGPELERHPDDASVGSVVEAAVRNHDEHVLKFTEVAVESHHRGNPAALAAAGRAAELISPGW